MGDALRSPGRPPVFSREAGPAVDDALQERSGTLPDLSAALDLASPPDRGRLSDHIQHNGAVHDSSKPPSQVTAVSGSPDFIVDRRTDVRNLKVESDPSVRMRNG